MLFSTTLLAALLSCAFAAPTSTTPPPTTPDHRLEDIQCHCLTLSTDAKPTVCTYMGAHHLDWQIASTLANDYDLKINFASRDTIDKVLAIRKPLPGSVLRSIREGEAGVMRDGEGLVKRENRIVCGFGDEGWGNGEGDGEGMGGEGHYVGVVVVGFMGLVACYVVAEYVWSRYVCAVFGDQGVELMRFRFFSQGSIKLDGDEKALMAEYEAEEQDEEEAATTDVS